MKLNPLTTSYKEKDHSIDSFGGHSININGDGCER